ncbi:hypothetical protein COB11_08415 [Candidatus Aerophobetes bacterium]|uniref:Lantibiotic dehydratase N-terminal domain-containing protein n=1 Tax=Aerophobetes bacterium TaxID=2030807 RepID=A0A2A4Y9T8_UNCAE|nr:MAG: hypothetical protein COB11_08415 [Candidatus Aerophobetes bacterium]
MFSGVGPASWKGNSKKGVGKLYSRIQIDHQALNFILHQLQKTSAPVKQLNYFSNSSLFSVDRIKKYFEVRQDEFFSKSEISKVDSNEYLEKIISFCKTKKSFTQIVEVLISEEIEKDEAEEYISELIRNNFLVSELFFSHNSENELNRINLIFHKIKDLDLWVLELLWALVLYQGIFQSLPFHGKEQREKGLYKRCKRH